MCSHLQIQICTQRTGSVAYPPHHACTPPPLKNTQYSFSVILHILFVSCFLTAHTVSFQLMTVTFFPLFCFIYCKLFYSEVFVYL